MAKLIIKKTDPPVTEIYRAKTPADITADVRDSLNYFTGRGLTGLNDDESRAEYGKLVNTIGREQAQRLATSVFLHNQRPETLKMSPEQRIQHYYSTNSNNPDVQNTLNKVKSFGQGVLPGFQGSSLLGNMILAGREQAPVANVPETDRSKKVKILINSLAKKS